MSISKHRIKKPRDLRGCDRIEISLAIKVLLFRYSAVCQIQTVKRSGRC